MYLLEMNHIKKSFDGQGVLKDISLAVAEGEIVSIIGPSGSGKSTLLRCATMLERMDSGELLYLGERRPGTALTEPPSMQERKNKRKSREITASFSRILTYFPITMC